MFKTMFESIVRLLSGQSLSFQILGWAVVALLVIVGFYLIVSLLFFPGMYLFNRLTDRNQSNSLSKEELFLGQLTLRIRGESIGEVMETGSQEARSTYPAKLFREKDRVSGLELEKGTKVIIIEFDDQGIAWVVENKNK